MRTATPVIAALATALLIAGCDSTEPGNPASATTASTSAATEESDLPRYGAPKVEVPLDIRHFLQAPCDSLTGAQVEEFLGSGTSTRPRPDGPTGPDCGWNVEGTAGILVVYPDLDKLGLSSLYHNREENAFFEEMPPADGYPTVAYGVGDDRDKGECGVRVGTSDSETVDVSMALGEGALGRFDPCEAAHDVATKVIGNIKARD